MLPQSCYLYIQANITNILADYMSRTLLGLGLLYLTMSAALPAADAQQPQILGASMQRLALTC